jgi:starch-binding outer membrane protein, SusD/RagB family
MKNIKYILLLVFSGILFQSCKDLDLAPIDKASDLTFWEKKQDAINAVNACYGDLYDAETLIFGESLSDNAYTKSNNGSLVRDVANGNFDAAHPLMQQVWAQRYAGIRRCNTVLANIDRVPDLDPALNARLKAETRFIRAFHYFILVNHFGGVPLVETEISIGEAGKVTRSERDAVVAFIYRELDLAFQDLPRNNAYAAEDAGRITKGAALALKARMELYNGEWNKVVATTQQIMAGSDAGSYALFPSYGGLFKMENENNSEIILDVQYMPIRRTHGVQYFLIPPTEGGYAAISPSQELVNNYVMTNGKAISEAGSGWNESDPYTNRDPRLKATIVHHGYEWTRPDGSKVTINTNKGTGDNSIGYSSNTTATGYYIAKFFDPTAQNLVNSGLNLPLIRYADVLLMHAEAQMELGQLNEAVWDATIGQIRRRAGFTDPAALGFPGVAAADLKSIVRNERRSELAMEGLRIFDIRRWKTAETVLNGWLHGVKTDNQAADNGYERVDQRVFDPGKHYLWPVPQSERDKNALLVQNPNW